MNRSDRPSLRNERIDPSGTERDRTRETPGTDMQPEDAGTAASGNDESRAAQTAMKQTSKTERERGSR